MKILLIVLSIFIIKISQANEPAVVASCEANASGLLGDGSSVFDMNVSWGEDGPVAKVILTKEESQEVLNFAAQIEVIEMGQNFLVDYNDIKGVQTEPTDWTRQQLQNLILTVNKVLAENGPTKAIALENINKVVFYTALKTEYPEDGGFYFVEFYNDNLKIERKFFGGLVPLECKGSNLLENVIGTALDFFNSWFN